MEQAKQKISDLISIITERFPDENDLKGFLGISRALIIEMLTQCDGLLTTLKEHDNSFETIILKREQSEIFEKLFKELEEKFDKIKADKFNTILKLISKLRFLIRETYAAVINSAPIRTEAELAKAKEEFTLLSNNNEELKRINTDLLTLRDTTVQNLTNISNESTTLRDGISNISLEISEFKNKSTTTVAELEENQKKALENEKLLLLF